MGYHMVDKNGNIKTIVPYVNGAENGLVKEYAEDGVLLATHQMAYGMKNGMSTEYYPNGQKMRECNYENDNFNLVFYKSNIKGNIAYLDFLLDRLYDMKYINEKNLYNITTKLIEINKMVSGWLNNKDESTYK